MSTASIAGLAGGVNPSYNVTKYGVVALSEGLRPTLAEKGIGVSVLCPGLIRTQILDSTYNVFARFGRVEAMTEGGEEESEAAQMIRMGVAMGIDPDYVGELVRRGDRGGLGLYPDLSVKTPFL